MSSIPAAPASRTCCGCASSTVALITNSAAPGLAGESVGAAHAQAAQLGGTAGEELAATAGRAFTDALGIGLTAAAAVALIGAVLVALKLPIGRSVSHSAVPVPASASGRTGS